MINRNFKCKAKKVILIPLYKSIVRPHSDYCVHAVQAWRLHYRKDIEYRQVGKGAEENDQDGEGSGSV